VLAACDIGNALVEQTSRDVAKGVVSNVIQQKFPGTNVAPYTDCVLDNASFDEVLEIAQSAATGGKKATALVLEIAARPATAQCIAVNVLGSALG